MKLFFLILLLLTTIGPLWILCSGKIDFHSDWRSANYESAHLAPDPKTVLEAVVQVYSARTYSWRGIFAVHTWLAIKPQNAQEYFVSQVIGWRRLTGLPVLIARTDVPDRNWFGNKPKIILDLRGKVAEKIIPELTKVVATYPYPKKYYYWPGPNSNTFIAYIGRKVPALKLTLPGNAIGKDYLPNNKLFASTPSGTGYQFSCYGLLGITLALREGIEINILGLVYGISFTDIAIKLPGFGDIKLFPQQ